MFTQSVIRPFFAWVIVGLLFSSSAFGWGSQGHQVIALIAQEGLDPAAQAAVNRLLAQEPGQTLVSISTWADEHRSPQTAAWHYVNLPKGDCNYDGERDCPDGRCVVAAIQRQTAILASTQPDEKRLLALKYLVHLVGDVHQPLHAGYLEDRGGNTYQLQAFGRGTNLHAVWDSGLIQSMNLEVQGLFSELVKVLPKEPISPWTPAQAAQESCTLAQSEGFYPGRNLDSGYLQRYIPVMQKQLTLAGTRLADLLNRTFKDR